MKNSSANPTKRIHVKFSLDLRKRRWVQNPTAQPYKTHIRTHAASVLSPGLISIKVLRPCFVGIHLKFIYKKNLEKIRCCAHHFLALAHVLQAGCCLSVLLSATSEIIHLLFALYSSRNCLCRNAHKQLFFGSAFQLVLNGTFLFPGSLLIYYYLY